MTDQPTTPAATATTTSAREILHHLDALAADPYIPEVHEEDDTVTTTPDAQPADICPGTHGVDRTHDWRRVDGDLFRCGYCPAERRYGPPTPEATATDQPRPAMTMREIRQAPGHTTDMVPLVRPTDDCGTETHALRERVTELEAERDACAESLLAAQGDIAAEAQRADRAEAERNAHRAAVLREAADRLANAITNNPACRPGLHPGVQAAADELRRMAAAPAGAEDGQK